MHCPRHRLRGTLSLGLGSLARARGYQPIYFSVVSLAMNKAAINAAIIRAGYKKRPSRLWLSLCLCLVAGACCSQEPTIIAYVNPPFIDDDEGRPQGGVCVISGTSVDHGQHGLPVCLGTWKIGLRRCQLAGGGNTMASII